MKGEHIEIEKTNFNVEWKTLNVNLVNSKNIIQGLKEIPKTIYNTPDVNYKYISFPVKYSIITHPEYSYTTVTENNKQFKENNIKLGTPSVKIIQDESDFYLIFSNLKIIIFFISIFILIFFILIL